MRSSLSANTAKQYSIYPTKVPSSDLRKGQGNSMNKNQVLEWDLVPQGSGDYNSSYQSQRGVPG